MNLKVLRRGQCISLIAYIIQKSSKLKYIDIYTHLLLDFKFLRKIIGNQESFFKVEYHRAKNRHLLMYVVTWTIFINRNSMHRKNFL